MQQDEQIRWTYYATKLRSSLALIDRGNGRYPCHTKSRFTIAHGMLEAVSVEAGKPTLWSRITPPEEPPIFALDMLIEDIPQPNLWCGAGHVHHKYEAKGHVSGHGKEQNATGVQRSYHDVKDARLSRHEAE